MYRSALASALGALAVVVTVAGPAVAEPRPEFLRQVSVTGEATVVAEPDLARVTISTRSEATTASQALTMNTADAAKVAETLAGMGIEARDVATRDVSMSPIYDHQNSTPRIAGYAAQNRIEITVRDLSKVGAVLDAAVSAGADTIDGLVFDTADRPRLEEEARRNAAVDARARADDLAKTLGFTIEGVIEVQAAPIYRPAPMMAKRAEVMAFSDAVPVSPGGIDIQAQTTVLFEIGNPKN